MTQAESVDADKVGSGEPKQPKPFPFNTNLALLELCIERRGEERRGQ